MIERFQGPSGQRAFYEAVLAQQCVCHDPDVANALCAAATLSEFQAGETLVQAGAHDNDIYFILAGQVSVFVKGRELAIRRAEQHFGEIAMIDRSSTRSATIAANQLTVIARVPESKFTDIAEKHPFVWRCLANELGRRIREREKHVKARKSAPAGFHWIVGRRNRNCQGDSIRTEPRWIDLCVDGQRVHSK